MPHISTHLLVGRVDALWQRLLNRLWCTLLDGLRDVALACGVADFAGFL